MTLFPEIVVGLQMTKTRVRRSYKTEDGHYCEARRSHHVCSSILEGMREPRQQDVITNKYA